MQERRSVFITNLYFLMGTFFLTTVTLIYTKTILVPFTISIFIYVIISPMIYWFQVNCRMHRIVATLITLVCFFIAAGGLVILMVNSFESFFSSAYIYKERLMGLTRWVSDFAGRFGIELNASSIQNELSRLPVLSITRGFTGGVVLLFGKHCPYCCFCDVSSFGRWRPRWNKGKSFG